MKKICISVLLLTAGIILNGAPWVSSNYMYSDSNPALRIGQNVKLLRQNDRLFFCGQKGLMFFELNGKKWNLFAKKSLSVVDAALSKKYLAVICRDGLFVFNPVNGKLIIKSLKLKASSRYYKFSIGALSDGNFIVFAADSLYNYNPAKNKLDKLYSGLAKSQTFFAAKHDKVYILNGQNLFCYNGENVTKCHVSFVGTAKNLFFVPGKDWLCISTKKQGLTLWNTKSGKMIDYTGSKNPIGLGLCWWGFAWNKSSNILFIPGWNTISVIANADNPSKWKIVDKLTPCSKVPLYTYKCAYPQGKKSILFSPETKQLLFANKCGVTIMNSSSNSPVLVENENFNKFEFHNSQLAGKGKFYDWLRGNKLKAIYATSSRRLTEEFFRNYKKLSVNALIFNIFSIDHGQFYPPFDVRGELARVEKLCLKYDVKLFAHLNPYNISINNSKQLKDCGYRKLICSSGQVGTKIGTARIKKYPKREFPCYFDQVYSEAAGIAYQMKQLGELSKKIKLQGICFELGDGFLGTNIKVRRDPCLCDHCWNFFLKKINSANVDDAKIPTAKRYRRLLKMRKWDQYLRIQKDKLVKICRNALKGARKINSELVIVLMLPETTQDYTSCWFYNAFIEGMTSPDKPVLIASEQTYGSPYMPRLVNNLKSKWDSKGIPTIIIPGISFFWMAPGNFKTRMENYLSHSAGVFVYNGNGFSNKALRINCFKSLNKLDKTRYNLIDYLKADPVK